MDTNWKEKLEELRTAFEGILQNYTDNMNFKPDILNESMKYSLVQGGKRLRPVLMFACAQMLGGKVQDVAGFGEGQAILAGDALLNEAYSICFEECSKGKSYRNAAAFLCKNAGAYGMVAGQAADLFWQGRLDAGKAEADFIVLNKTAKMIMSAVTVPAYVYNADENIIALFSEFGKNFGFLFQITDDILDETGEFEKLGKTVGKDKQENKLSALALFGREKSEELADHYCNICLQILNEMPYESGFLQALTQYVRRREA